MFGSTDAGEDRHAPLDELDELRAVVDRLVRVPIAGAPLRDVQRINREISRLQAVVAARVRAADVSGTHRDEGALTMPAWLRATGMSKAASFSLTRRARMLEGLPELAAVFAAGEVNAEHVDALARVWTPSRESELTALDAELAGFCRLASPDQVRSILRGLCEQIDGDGGAGEDAKLDARQHLYASVLANGMVKLDGLLSPDVGETVLSVLNAIMETDRDAPGDPVRERPRRRADALAIAFQLVSTHSEQLLGEERVLAGGRNRPVMRSVVDLALFREEGTLSVERLAAIRAEVEHVGRLSRTTLERIACDCSISGVVIDGTSEPLNVGRQKRTPSAAQWAALVVRDGGCTHPGCTAPVSWCEAHHILFWERGGPTDLWNLKLLCWKHHRLLHQLEAMHRRNTQAA